MDRARGYPCIKLIYTPQCERIAGMFDEKLFVHLWAMVDTGATHNVVDETICSSAPILRHVPAEGFLANGLATVRRGTLIFRDKDGFGVPCHDEFCGAPISDKPYKAVIGRDFLKVCRLIFDGPTGDYRLQVQF